MGKKEEVLGDMLESLEKVAKKMAGKSGVCASECSREDRVDHLEKVQDKVEILLQLIKKEKAKEVPQDITVYLVADVGNIVLRFASPGTVTGEGFLVSILKRDAARLEEEFSKNFYN